MKTDDNENFIVGIELHSSRPDSGQREKKYNFLKAMRQEGLKT